MDAYIVADDPAVATRLRALLEKCGINCPAARCLRHDGLGQSRGLANPSAAKIVFMVVAALDGAALRLMKQLVGGTDSPTKVVVIGPAGDGQGMLAAIRAGASDYVDLGSNLDNEIREVLQRLTASPQSPVRQGKLFTVVGTTGGAGTSFVACNVAAALAAKEGSVALLDLHLRGGDLALLLNCSPQYTLMSLAAKKDRVDKVMFEQSLTRHECGIHLLASPDAFADFRIICPDLVLNLVQMSRSNYQSVVVDLEDCNHEEQVRVLSMSQRVLLVLRPDFVSLYRAKRLIEFLTRAKISTDQVTVIANRMGQPRSLPIERMEEVLGMPILYRLPEDAEAVNASVNLGSPLVVSQPGNRVAQSLQQAVDALLGGRRDGDKTSWARRQLDWLSKLRVCTA